MPVTDSHLKLLETTMPTVQASLHRLEDQLVELLKIVNERKKRNEQALGVPPVYAIEEENLGGEIMAMENFEEVEATPLIISEEATCLSIDQSINLPILVKWTKKFLEWYLKMWARS